MDLNELSRIFTEEYNNQRLDDFSGFTPKQMQQIIYFPFSLNSPIKVYIDFELRYLKSSPIFNISYSLLSKINESGRIRLTQKGNLPGDIIRTIYDEGFFLDTMIEHGYTKLRKEKDWLILHTVHIVLKLSGLIKKHYGHLYLTKKGGKLLYEGNESSLFFKLIETYSLKYNWGYNDLYDLEDIGQMGFLYMLFLLKKYGDQYEDILFYSKLYFKAFPVFVDRYRKDIPYAKNDPENALSIRFFERFAYWFGFITYQGSDDLPYRDRNAKIKKTDLLESFLD